MNKWADLHGEDNERIVWRPSRTAVWCDNCQCFVERLDWKRWTGDDMQHWLCPGCDADMCEPEIMD